MWTYLKEVLQNNKPFWPVYFVLIVTLLLREYAYIIWAGFVLFELIAIRIAVQNRKTNGTEKSSVQ